MTDGWGPAVAIIGLLFGVITLPFRGKLGAPMDRASNGEPILRRGEATWITMMACGFWLLVVLLSPCLLYDGWKKYLHQRRRQPPTFGDE